MKKIESWLAHAAIFAAILFGVFVVAWITKTSEEAEESEAARIISIDSLREAQEKLPTVTIVEEDTTYELDAARLQTISDSIHYFEDGF